VHLANEQLAYEAVGDGQRLVVALSVGERPAEVPVHGAGRVLAGDAEVLDAGQVRLPAHGWAVLEG
jgi:hypothetical protein